MGQKGPVEAVMKAEMLNCKEVVYFCQGLDTETLQINYDVHDPKMWICSKCGEVKVTVGQREIKDLSGSGKVCKVGFPENWELFLNESVGAVHGSASLLCPKCQGTI